MYVHFSQLTSITAILIYQNEQMFSKASNRPICNGGLNLPTVYIKKKKKIQFISSGIIIVKYK